MSVSSVSLSSDANVRYQRLAQEYTKLRAQAKVLREGVLEERTKVEKLSEDLKSKEAQIRRIESENESLIFRNDQLARRVETYQSSKTSSSEVNELLEAELRQKSEENEKLQSIIAENEQKHLEALTEMSGNFKEKITILEEEVRKLSQKSKIGDKAMIEKKEEEKDNRNGHVEHIGSPEPPESMEEVQLMVAEAVRHNFGALHNVFNLLQQRAEIYPFDVTMERLPPHVQKLSSELAQTARLFSELTSQMDNFLQTYPETSLQDPELQDTVVSKLCQVSAHFRHLLPDLIRQMTSEESRVTWCTAQLAKINNQWEERILEFFTVFQVVAEALKAGNYQDVAQKLLEDLSKCANATSSCFKSRWQLESRLPTTTRRMRCVGAALEESLVHWGQESEKLAARTARIGIMIHEAKENEKNEEKIENLKRFEPEIQHPTAPEPTELKKPTNSTIPEAPEPHNPFDDEDSEDSEALETPEPKFSISDAQKLAEFVKTDLTAAQRPSNPPVSSDLPRNPDQVEVSHLVSRNEQLQKERDRLLVEFSLVKRKFEIATGGKFKLAEDTPDIDVIWDCGMERRDEWIKKVYEAEKAVRFYQTEFDLLLRQELVTEETTNRLKLELSELTAQNQKLEDELESVRRSYEGQLGDLSEHLASLVKEREKDKEGNKSRSSLKSFFNKS